MKFKDGLIKIKDVILEALFPNNIKCILCGRDVPTLPFCDDCLKQPIFNEGNRCIICDSPIKEDNIICDHCKKIKRAFKKLYAPLIYDGKVRKALIRFKSDGAACLAPHFAKLMAERLDIEQVEYDIIVPVPSHKSSRKERGYNPAKVLADELSKIVGKPVEDVLYKTIRTKNQKYLDYESRQTNLENTIILLNNSAIKNKNILIVDDIITTGATIDACAKLLCKANNIYGCAVARRKHTNTKKEA